MKLIERTSPVPTYLFVSCLLIRSKVLKSNRQEKVNGQQQPVHA